MKKFIKISRVAIAFLMLTKIANAQSSSEERRIFYSIGVESGISSGNFNNLYKWNIGGSIQADIPLTGGLYASVNAGYLNFNGTVNENGSNLSAANISFLPIKAGLKYFPITDWYIQGNAGVGFILYKNDVGYDKSAAFLYTPQIGVLLKLGGKNYIDAGVRYETTSKYISNNENSKINFFGLRVAYAFN